MYSILHQKRKNMVKIIIFVYFMTLFLSMFLVTPKDDGKPFISQFFNFLLYIVHNILSYFINNILFSFSIIGSIECISNIDCPQIFMLPFVMRCINFRCKIVNSEEWRSGVRVYKICAMYLRIEYLMRCPNVLASNNCIFLTY